jgi:hypothetical protein
MKCPSRSVEQVQGRYPHPSWVPHGRSIPAEPLINSPEPLITCREAGRSAGVWRAGLPEGTERLSGGS